MKIKKNLDNMPPPKKNVLWNMWGLSLVNTNPPHFCDLNLTVSSVVPQCLWVQFIQVGLHIVKVILILFEWSQCK